MISNLIKTAREEQKLTKKELAKRSNCTEAIIRNYESRRREPTLVIADRILKALGITLEIGAKHSD